MTVVSPSSGTNYAIDVNATIAGSLTVIRSIAIQGGGAGHGIRCSTSGITGIINGLYHNGGTLGDFLIAPGGQVLVTDIIANVGSSTNFINVTAGSLDVNNIMTQSSTLYTCTDLIDISCGSIDCNGLLLPDDNSPCTNALHISGNAVAVSMTNVHLHANAFAILVDPALTGSGGSVKISGEYEIEKTSYPSGWKSAVGFLSLYNDDGIFDDPGTKVEGGFFIGNVDNPTELVVGEGNSSIINMNVLYSTNVTNIGGATYTNNTNAARTKGDPSFTMFSSLTNGNGLFIGNTSRKFYGIKVDIVTALTAGSGILTWYYHNGTSWVEFDVMWTLADAPYTHFGRNCFNTTASEQIRFNYNAINANWATQTVNSINAYWVYVRIGRPTADTLYPNIRPQNTNSITTSPVLQRIKLHTNRTEINKDGYIEYFGSQEKKVHVDYLGAKEDPNRTAGTANITLSSNVSISRQYSSFSGNSLSGQLIEIILPYSADTSRPLNVDIYWKVDNTSLGNVRLYMNYVVLTAGVTVGALTEYPMYDVSNLGNNYVDRSFLVSGQNVIQEAHFTAKIPHLGPDKQILINLYRDARGSNTNDTNSSSISIARAEIHCWAWC